MLHNKGILRIMTYIIGNIGYKSSIARFVIPRNVIKGFLRI